MSLQYRSLQIHVFFTRLSILLGCSFYLFRYKMTRHSITTNKEIVNSITLWSYSIIIQPSNTIQWINTPSNLPKEVSDIAKFLESQIIAWNTSKHLTTALFLLVKLFTCFFCSEAENWKVFSRAAVRLQLWAQSVSGSWDRSQTSTLRGCDSRCCSNSNEVMVNLINHDMIKKNM